MKVDYEAHPDYVITDDGGTPVASLYDYTTAAEWTNESSGMAGVYYPVSGSGSAGIATVSVYAVTNIFPKAATGVYTNDGAGSWFYNGAWQILEGWDNLDTANPQRVIMHLSGANPTGVWYAYDGFFYETLITNAATSRWDYVYTNNPVDPSGTFTPNGDFESKPAWINGAWSVVYSNGWYYITTSTNELSPAWKRETESAGAHSPGLTYSIIVGTNIAGTATAVYRYLYEPVYQTNIIYECSLRKVSADYYAYTGTDVAHAVQGFYVWPSVLTLLGSDSNVFSAHGLAITNDVWNEVYDGVGGFTNATENTQNFGGSLAATPPEEGPNPTESIPSVTSGFILNVAPRFIFDWNFLYGTNRYW